MTRVLGGRRKQDDVGGGRLVGVMACELGDRKELQKTEGGGLEMGGSVVGGV